MRDILLATRCVRAPVVVLVTAGLLKQASGSAAVTVDASASFSATLNATANVSVVDPTLVITNLDLSKLPLDKLPLDRIPLNLLPLKDVDWSNIHWPNIQNLNIGKVDLKPTINIPPTTMASLAVSAFSFAFQQVAAAKEEERWNALGEALVAIQRQLQIMDRKLDNVIRGMEQLNRSSWEILYGFGQIPGAVWRTALIGQVDTMQLRGSRYLHDLPVLRRDIDDLQVKLNTALASGTPVDLAALSIGLTEYLALAKRAGISAPERARELEHAHVRFVELLIGGVEESDNDPDPLPSDSLAVQIRKFERRIRQELRASTSLWDGIQKGGPSINCMQQGPVPAQTFGVNGYPNLSANFDVPVAVAYNWNPIPKPGYAVSEVGTGIDGAICFAAKYDVPTDFRPNTVADLPTRLRDIRIQADGGELAPVGLLQVNPTKGDYVLSEIFFYPKRLGWFYSFQNGSCRLAVDGGRLGSIRPSDVDCRYGEPARLVVSAKQAAGCCVGPAGALVSVTALKGEQLTIDTFAERMKLHGAYESTKTALMQAMQPRLARANQDLRRIKTLSALARVIAAQTKSLTTIEAQIRSEGVAAHWWCLTSALPGCP